MSAVLTLSGEVLVAVIFALINLQIQIRLMAWWWARGCTWQQFLDIYALGEKSNKWMIADIVANSALMIIAGVFFTWLGWTLTNTMIMGALGIECLALACIPFRFVGAKIAVRNNPNLLDFNGKYKGTHNEYKKLVMLLDEKKLGTYTRSASRLWSELLLLNKRRNEAYAANDRLEEIKNDVQKLITAYSVDDDVDKRLKAQARLNKIIKQQADIEEFTKQVEDQILKSENVFMDIRTKLAVGQIDNILPDLSSYTNQVKSLEITVEAMDGGEIAGYPKGSKTNRTSKPPVRPLVKPIAKQIPNKSTIRK